MENNQRVLAYELAVEIKNEELEAVSGGFSSPFKIPTFQVTDCLPTRCHDLTTD